MKRLSFTYFLYFGQLGVLVPYLGLFLDGRGFTSAQIGELFALITLARILGPTLWASLADKTGKVLPVLQVGCCLTVISFLGVFWAYGFWWLTLLMGLMMMFWTAVLPQLEVITLQQTQTAGVAYGKVRLWGSVGFIVLTILTGQLLDFWGSEVPVYVSVGVLSLLFISTLLISHPNAPKTPKTNTSSNWHSVISPVFLVFLLSATLLQMSFGAYYGFFALYMRDLGYSGQVTGLMIALGVLAEIFIFLLSTRLISRFGVKWVLVGSTLLTALRWYLLGYHADFLAVIGFAQLLHAFSFGLTHAASVFFIHKYFETAFQSRGQAIYISVAFGAGGALGNWVAGLIWQQGVGSTMAFAVATLVAVIGAVVLLPMHRQRFDCV